MEEILPQSSQLNVDSQPQVSTPGSIASNANSNFIKLSIIGLLILVPVVGFSGYYLGSQNKPTSLVIENSPEPSSLSANPTLLPVDNKQVVCTLDAKLCPDGSSVGRTGPNCEFAECSTVQKLGKLNFNVTYPDGYEVLSENSYQIIVGSVGIKYLTFNKENTIDVKKLSMCSENTMVFPCLSIGENWGQSEDVKTVIVGGKPAVSFYITTGTVDSAEHVVQVPGEFEARMNVAGGGLDQAFKMILDSVVFTK